MDLGSLAPGDRIRFRLSPELTLAPVYCDRFGAEGSGVILTLEAGRGRYSYAFVTDDRTRMVLAVLAGEILEKIAG